MRFLDLDLDFFLNKNAYRAEGGERLGPEYRPWGVARVRRFLEYRCGLSTEAPVRGRTVESHDELLDLWCSLIESGVLEAPFEVTHIDAHPDLAVGDGLYLEPGFLRVDPRRRPDLLGRESVHPGNYLTFAVASGWVAALVWVPLSGGMGEAPIWDADAAACSPRGRKRVGKSSPVEDRPVTEMERGVPFRIVPWREFRTSGPFDYMALSTSPDFTPPESDRLVAVVEEYMRRI